MNGVCGGILKTLSVTLPAVWLPLAGCVSLDRPPQSAIPSIAHDTANESAYETARDSMTQSDDDAGVLRDNLQDAPVRSGIRSDAPGDVQDRLLANGQLKGTGTRSQVVPLVITRPQRTGFVENEALREISGLAVSQRLPGVLFGINDSGNPATLFALSETGAHLGQWSVDARNRDWEDMSTARLNGKPCLVLGDTGDNLQVHRESVLYFVEEPALSKPETAVLQPALTLRYRYEDGPRNVEAFAVTGNEVYLVSKEPVQPGGSQASRLYRLTIPDADTQTLQVARYVGSLPLPRSTLTTRLAAALVGVDLNHPTALEFDTAGNTAYLLTYRQVLRIARRPGQSWGDAFASSWTPFYTHDLQQAEALAVAPGESVWITSENGRAPLWALPVGPPA